MSDRSTVDPTPAGPTRRSVLVGAGAAAALAALGGCAAYDSAGGAAPPPDPGVDPGSTDPIALTSDVPVGGAVIISARRVVVSQPEEGTFKAFSAQCTHQGCLVSGVEGDTIVCACHGSAFNAGDGSVVRGPANRPLPEVAIAVDGTGIKLA